MLTRLGNFPGLVDLYEKGGEQSMKKVSHVEQKLKNEKINLCLKVLMALLFFIGAMVFSYPFVVDAINNFYDQRVIEHYQKEYRTVHKVQQETRLAKMKSENAALLKQKHSTNIPGMGLVEDPFEVTQKNNPSPSKAYFQEHMIGAIFIPSIHVSLPIFNETNAELLDKGATVLQGTSYPIGGISTHSVLTGHSGLPDKKLFTDLDDLNKGDLFYIEVSGKKLAYRVTNFKTVLPTQLDSLEIVTGKDLVTLVTCTPYMINTHRLLVTGERVPFVAQKMDKAIKKAQAYHQKRLLIFAVGLPIFCLLFSYFIWRKFVYYLCIKHRYDFVFYALADGQALPHLTFYLVEKKGQVPVLKDGKPLKVVSDTKGRVLFEGIAGGRYIAYCQQQGAFPKVIGFVRFLHDTQFTLKSRSSIVKRIGKRKNCRYTIDRGA